MAQWVASANSLGHRYIDDPRADEEARIGQLLLANRAQRENEAARREAMAFQAQQAQERTRQFDEELARRQQSEDFQAFQWLTGMDTAAAERQRAQENADRLFAASRQDASQRFDLERAQEDRLREASLFARRQADDPLARAAEQAKLALLLEQANALRRQPEIAAQEEEARAARDAAREEAQLRRSMAVAEAATDRAEASNLAQEQRQQARIDAAMARDAEERAAVERKAAAEAQARRAAGLRDTVYNFQQALSGPKGPKFQPGGWVTESDRAKAAADLMPVLEQAFLGGFDPNRADARPSWAPTSPEDEALLVEALRRVLAERYPAMRRDLPWTWDSSSKPPEPFFDEDPVAKVQSRWGASLFAPR